MLRREALKAMAMFPLANIAIAKPKRENNNRYGFELIADDLRMPLRQVHYDDYFNKVYLIGDEAKAAPLPRFRQFTEKWWVPRRWCQSVVRLNPLAARGGKAHHIYWQDGYAELQSGVGRYHYRAGDKWLLHAEWEFGRKITTLLDCGDGEVTPAAIHELDILGDVTPMTLIVKLAAFRDSGGRHDHFFVELGRRNYRTYKPGAC